MISGDLGITIPKLASVSFLVLLNGLFIAARVSHAEKSERQSELEHVA